MLAALQSVIRCTAVSDNAQILAHVAISGGLVHAFNGRMYACAKAETNPIGLDAICVKADLLIAALRVIGDSKVKSTVDMEHGVLKLASNGYRAHIPIRSIEDFYLQTMPAKRGARAIDFDLVETLRLLRPFVGDNPAQLWSHGFFLDGASVSVTNAMSMARQTTSSLDVQSAIITAEFADELIAQASAVQRMLIHSGRVTVWLESGAVISSVIVDGVWPRSFDTVCGTMHKGATFTPVPEGLSEALQSVVPFSVDAKTAVVTLTGGKLELVSSETAGAAIDVEGLQVATPCAFKAGQLQTLLNVASEWDLSKFPMVPFRNKELSIIGGVAGVKA